ncbi:MAG: fimbrillin family protein, partial [Bacteroides sp.]|nr:fimbrillin family protein [Bacteroides sp.]
MQKKNMTYNQTARKLLLPLLAVCLCFICSCGNLYTGEENVFDPDRDETIQEESIPVMVALSDPYYNILSRGVGKVDPEDEYFYGKMNPVDEEGNPDTENKPRFFIYAFRKNKGDYSITRAEDKEMCLIDGSCGTQADWAREKDSNMEGHGKWAYYNGNGSFVNWHFLDDKIYYSNDSQMTPYEFFAYFHDGAATDKATRTADRIFFPVKIDGSQDLMCGTAELTEEQLKTIDEITDEAEKQKIKEFYYSTYTGRRNIWPIMKLKHQLAYIKVNLIAGNDFGDAVLVNDIRLETHTEGTFVVASKDQKIGATFETGKGIEQLPLRNIKTGAAILPGEDEPAEEET